MITYSYIVPPVHSLLQSTECAETLKLLCVALLDDHLALKWDTHPFAGVRAHALQLVPGTAAVRRRRQSMKPPVESSR